MSKPSYVTTALLSLLVAGLIGCGGGGSAQSPVSPSPPPPTGSQASTSQLTVTVAGMGAGSVTSTPAGVQCTPSCSASFNNGTSVTLTAAPTGNNGSVFAGWSGACSGTGPCTFTINAATTVTATFNASLQSIQHIIFMLQENRSFDEYFGKLNDYRMAHGLPADVDGLPLDASNPSVDGSSTVAAFHMISMCAENPSPGWKWAHIDANRDNPTSTTMPLNGFVLASAEFAQQNGLSDVQGIRPMGYYDASDLPYYYFMASNFATSDRWFSPVMTATEANRMYVLAATSAGYVYPLVSGSPLLTKKTIFQLLEEHGISWKVYVTDPTPSAVAAGSMSMYAFSFQHPDKFVPISQFFADLSNDTLPAVAMIEPGYLSGRDEHPVGSDTSSPGGSVQYGSKYVSSLINALMTSPAWIQSVFILSFDEYGGFYDHVPPQPTVAPDGILPNDLRSVDPCNAGGGSSVGGGSCGFTYTGYRIPLIVVSPFAKKNYVSHTVADLTAILKLIETRFQLPSLTRRDAAQMDMTEFFDFVNEPWKMPPTPPTQPVNKPCYVNHLP